VNESLAQLIVYIACFLMGAGFAVGVIHEQFQTTADVVLAIVIFGIVGFALCYLIAVPVVMTQVSGITGVEDAVAYIGFLPWQALDKAFKDSGLVWKSLLFGAGTVVVIEVLARRGKGDSP
jgi:hypothetical protein